MYQKTATIVICGVLSLGIILGVLSPQMFHVYASSSYTGAAKPMEFLFHYVDVPVQVAGLETKYIFNTTRDFQFVTYQDAQANSFYKPVGLPKIVVDFYLYPNLAGPVTIDGLWQVSLWVNASAYKPANFAMEFREITIGGVELWDSGQITPTVTSSIGGYIDVPVHNYNLSAPLTHVFQADTTLQVSIEVNAGSSADTRIWYDSPYYPSKIILPATDYARPIEVKTYMFDDTETTLFFYNWSHQQRNVIIRANVTDPFGGYDIYHVNMTISDPSNTSVLENIVMQRISEGPKALQFSHMFEANWSYPSTTSLGNYTVTVAVVDTNGFYRKLDVGTFSPFIEYFTYTFTIGELVYYDPVLLIVDNEGEPLPNAQVYVTWPNGSRDVLPQYTSTEGQLNMTHILPANYSFTVSWKDTIVNQTTLYLDSDGPYTISTQVYHLTVTVLDNGGGSLTGAYVMVSNPSGIGYGLAISDESGQTVFKLPTGLYNVDVHYSSGYWLTTVTTQETKPAINVNDTIATEVRLTEFPPALWNTAGFWMLLSVVAGIALGVYLVFIRKH